MIHIEGYEQFNGEQSAQDVAAAFVRSGYSSNGNWSIVAGRGRYSRGISGQKAYVKRVVNWNTDTMTVGFAHRFDNRGSIAFLKIGAADVTLSMDKTTGLPRLGTTNGGAIPTKNRWYYYELVLERGAGKISLYINGKFDSAYIVGGGLVGNSVEVNLGYRQPTEYLPPSPAPAPDEAVKTYDDLYIFDAEALGPIMVTTRFPSHDEVIEWQKAGEETTHSASVSKFPPEPLDTYIASDTIGKQDVFTSAQQMSNTNPVLATGIVVLARKSPTIAAKLGVMMGGTVESRSAALDVGDAWQSQYVAFGHYNDAPADIVTSQFGVQILPQ